MYVNFILKGIRKMVGNSQARRIGGNGEQNSLKPGVRACKYNVENVAGGYIGIDLSLWENMAGCFYIAQWL